MLSSIPLTALIPSPTNPRTHFDPDKLNELAENFKLIGQLQPAVVRIMPEGKVPTDRLLKSFAAIDAISLPVSPGCQVWIA